ncbi:MAG: hypothetical protein KI790_02125 [Cyclobacteriaceae bacterium]|nr:hypothetical protein [Cyclobacteriaceae bacterium HetDA_MAG_MS6]
MHKIQPYYSWLQYYDSSFDDRSPYFGKEYNYDLYSETIYGYYIDPAWDYMGSETLYIKVLYVDYQAGYVIIELIGEWNDTLHNDIMHFKRNIVEHFLTEQINQFVLIGENVMNFHGSDDCYYEEWFEEVEEGWIAGVNFRDFVVEEMKNYNIDMYLNLGGSLDIPNWRALTPKRFYALINQLIMRRLN